MLYPIISRFINFQTPSKTRHLHDAFVCNMPYSRIQYDAIPYRKEDREEGKLAKGWSLAY